MGSKPSNGGSVIRLKEGLGVKSDAELARVLGIPASTVANWKSRGSVPVAVCLRAAADNNISLDWLVFGVEFPRLNVREVGMTAAVFGGVVLVGDDGEELTFEEIGERFSRCCNLIGQASSSRASIGARRHAFDALMGMLKQHQERSESIGGKTLIERMAGIKEADAGAGEVTGAGTWSAATEAERQQATQRFAAIQRSNALASEGKPRAEADAIAGIETGVSASAVGAWRGRIKGIVSPAAQKEALLDRPRTGRPTSLDASMQKTLEDLATRRGPHLTAEEARRVLVERHGEAPGVSTIRRWLTSWQGGNRRRPVVSVDQLPPDVHALLAPYLVAASGGSDETDQVKRATDLTESALARAEIVLGRQKMARLALAFYELLYEERDKGPAERAPPTANRVA